MNEHHIVDSSDIIITINRSPSLIFSEMGLIDRYGLMDFELKNMDKHGIICFSKSGQGYFYYGFKNEWSNLIDIYEF